jgi:hypothetical protein
VEAVIRLRTVAVVPPGELAGAKDEPVRGRGKSRDQGAHPSVKVCGACSRHVDDLVVQMEASSPESHRTTPMVWTIGELLEVWDDLFEDLMVTLAEAADAEWDAEADGQFR